MNTWQKLVLMEQYHDVLDELTKKYKNCYILLNSPSGSQHVVRYIKYDGHSNKFILQDEHGQAIQLNMDTVHNLDNLVVKPGLYQVGNRCVYGFYTGNRQYRKSINADSFCFVDPFYDEKAHCFEVNDCIFSVIKQDYPKQIATALTCLVEDNLLSIAVTRNFGIYKYGGNYYYLYRNAVIGKIINNKIEIHNKFFNQEVMDSMRYINYNEFEVVYAT